MRRKTVSSLPGLRHCMITRTRFVRNCAKHRKTWSERELLFAIGKSIVSSLLKRQRSDVKRLSGNLIDAGIRELRKKADYSLSSSDRHRFFLHLRQPKNNLQKL